MDIQSTFVKNQQQDYMNSLDLINTNDLRNQMGETNTDFKIQNKNTANALDVIFDMSQLEEIKPIILIKSKAKKSIELKKNSFIKAKILTEGSLFPATFSYITNSENFKLETYVGFNYYPTKMKYEFRSLEKEFIVDASKVESEDMNYMGIVIIAPKYFQCELIITLSGPTRYRVPRLQQIIESAPPITKNVKFNNELERLKMNNTEILKFEGDYEIDEAALSLVRLSGPKRQEILRRNVGGLATWKFTQKHIIRMVGDKETQRLAAAQVKKKEIHDKRMEYLALVLNRNESIKNTREALIDNSIYTVLRAYVIHSWMYFIKNYSILAVLQNTLDVSFYFV